MTVLLLGLLLFLGTHSLRVVAGGWRESHIARWGAGPWKGLYSLLSFVGLLLIVWGYGLARQQSVVLWAPPPLWLRHIAAVLMLLSFVLLAAAYVPRNPLKARLQHPMLLGVNVWALAHLLANNTLADLLLFGAFLLWAAMAFASSRRRDRAAGAVAAAGTATGMAITLVVGMTLWLLFAFWAHRWLFGVPPLAFPSSV